MLLWKDERARCVGQFAIAGDFLPASGLAPDPGRSWSDMAEHLRPIFQDVGFSIVNLECPAGVEGLQPKTKASLGDTFAAARESLSYLSALRASVVGLANNHIHDYGSQGVARTRDALARRSLSPIGTGRTLAQPPEICIQDLPQGLGVGVWAAALNLADAATHNRAGVEPATLDRGVAALASIEALGASCNVAFLHAGSEGTNLPDPEDVALMDALAASGFDIVVACHSHRISGYQFLRRAGNRLSHCFYGLGSLSSSVLYSALEREGLVVVAGVDERGRVARVEVRAVHLDSRGWGRVPGGEENSVILGRFQEISKQISDGSYRRLFYRDISKNLVATQWRDARVAFQTAGFRGIAGKLRRLRPGHVRRLYHKGLAMIGLD